MASEILGKADELLENHKPQEAYDLLKKAVTDGIKDPELYYRLAHACRNTALLYSKEPEKSKEYLDEGMAAARFGLDINPDHGPCNSWYAICLKYRSECEGPDEKIKSAYVMKEHWLKALKADPNDATTLHSMGMWCYNVTSLSWFKRQFAKMFFTAPPESSYEEALEYFIKCEKIKPELNANNPLYMAKCYMELKNKEKARECYEKVLEFPSINEEVESAKKEAEGALKKL